MKTTMGYGDNVDIMSMISTRLSVEERSLLICKSAMSGKNIDHLVI